MRENAYRGVARPLRASRAATASASLTDAYTWPAGGTRSGVAFSRMFDGLYGPNGSPSAAAAAKAQLASMPVGSTLRDLYSPRKLDRLVKDMTGRGSLMSAMTGFDAAKWAEDIQSVGAHRDVVRPLGTGGAGAAISTLTDAYTWPAGGTRSGVAFSRMFDGLYGPNGSPSAAAAAKAQLASMPVGSTLRDLYSPRKLDRLVKDMTGRGSLMSAMTGFDAAKWMKAAQVIDAGSELLGRNGRQAVATSSLAAAIERDRVFVPSETDEPSMGVDVVGPQLLEWLRQLPVSERHNLVSYLLTLLSPATTGLNATGIIEIPEPATSAIVAIVSLMGIVLIARSSRH